jgi:hypothetical protein
MFYVKQALKFTHSSCSLRLNPRTDMILQVLTTGNIMTANLCDTTPCSLFIDCPQHFGRTQRLCLHGLSLNTEIVCSSKTSVTTSRSTERHITYNHGPERSVLSSPLQPLHKAVTPHTCSSLISKNNSSD